MKIKLMKGVPAVLITLMVSGALAGFINGFIGASGGIILLYLFKHINPDKDKEAGRDNFAMVVAAVLPLCIVSAIKYSSHGAADPHMIEIFILPAAVGGVIGAFLTDRIKTDILKIIFAVIVIIAGINMVL